MSEQYDYIYLTAAYCGWTIATWQDYIDWGLGVLGALTLIALNIIRIHKTITNKRDVNK